MQQLRDKIRGKHHSIGTETAYVDWNKRFTVFHNRGHLEKTQEVKSTLEPSVNP